MCNFLVHGICLTFLCMVFDVYFHRMAYCSVSFFENGKKQMSTVPKCWIVEGMLLWPLHKGKARMWHEKCEPPKPDWLSVGVCTILKEGT